MTHRAGLGSEYIRRIVDVGLTHDCLWGGIESLRLKFENMSIGARRAIPCRMTEGDGGIPLRRTLE